MKVVRSQWLIAACGLVGLAMLASAANAAKGNAAKGNAGANAAEEETVSVEDAVKEARATGKPLLAVMGTES